MMGGGPKVITDFDWQDLHKKILKISVIPPNPECLEFWGEVYAQDEHGNAWLLHEWRYDDPTGKRKADKRTNR